MKLFQRLASLAVLLALCLACGRPDDPGGRVLVLGLDGMDPEIVDLLISEGKMPNFARLRKGGAYGPLRSMEPLLSPILWTTVATGKTAEQHGIGHFVAIDEAGRQVPATSDLRRVEALWTIASEAEKTVAVVGWWATWPPEEVNGSVVSDHVAYHFLFGDAFTGGAEEGKTWPPALAADIAPLLRRPDDLGHEELAPFITVPREELSRPFEFQDDLAHFRWALATAQSYRDIGLKLWQEKKPDLELVYIEGTDSASHLFGHLFRAEGLSGELAQQQARFGTTVEAMYLFADRLVGEYLDALDDDTTLMVLSDHGFELGRLHDDPSKLRDLRRVSEKFHKIDGILYLYGKGVKPRARLERASILDITPTVLALLGLPAAADMPGRVLTEAFDHPLPDERVVSYEGEGAARVAAAPGRAEDPTAQAQLDHLKSLGYLGGSSTPPEEASPPPAPSASGTSSPTGDQVLAAVHFQNGHYEEAAKLYRKLLAAEPDDARMRTSYAGALGALGRYDEALEQVTLAIEHDPLGVEAYHNRAALLERKGDPEAAIADYRRVVRYRPDYEPSREALLRLTGSAEAWPSRNAAEAGAQALLQQAADAARRTDFPTALRLLAEAEEQAPDYVLVHQYRANVAYLMGDRAAAAEALEKALALEPDNALFKANLEQVKADG